MLRDAMLEKAKTHVGDGSFLEYAEEVAEHKRDPYTLVEEIVGKLNKDLTAEFCVVANDSPANVCLTSTISESP